ARPRPGELLARSPLSPQPGCAFHPPPARECPPPPRPAARRARAHAAAARALAELHPDHLDERAALLAYHWEEAGELFEAARWYRRAAEWVSSKNSAEGARKWQQVRATAAQVPAPEADALGLLARAQLLILGARVGVPAEEAATIFAEGQVLAARTGDLGTLAILLCGYSNVKDMQGEPDEALRHAMAALHLAEQTR